MIFEVRLRDGQYLNSFTCHRKALPDKLTALQKVAASHQATVICARADPEAKRREVYSITAHAWTLDRLGPADSTDRRMQQLAVHEDSFVPAMIEGVRLLFKDVESLLKDLSLIYIPANMRKRAESLCIRIDATRPTLNRLEGKRVCPECKGRGEVLDDSDSSNPTYIPCDTCRATGRVKI